MSVGPKWRPWRRPNSRFMWARREGDKPFSLEIPKDQPKLWKKRIEVLNAFRVLPSHVAYEMYGRAPNAVTLKQAVKRELASAETATGKGGDPLSAAYKGMLAQAAKTLLRGLGEDTPMGELRARDIHEDDMLVVGERLARELAGLDRVERRRRVAAARLAYTAARLAEGASYSTIRKELLLLRRVLQDCARRHELMAPVAELLPPRWSARYTPRTCVLTAPQAWAVIEALPQAGRRASIAFLIGTGARRGEWWRARPFVHLDFTGETITLLGTKTKKARRTFWMSPIARPFLERCLRELASVPEDERPDFTFDKWSNVRRDLHAACDRAGAPHVSYKDLRRTFATLHARGGVAREDLVKFMGHSDDTMLRRIYDQTTEADHVRAARERYLRDHATPVPAEPEEPGTSPERRSA